MKPEDLIGPAAAKALAEHFTLTPIAKPLPEVVTNAEALAFMSMRGTNKEALSEFVLRWLRSRLEECTHNATGEDCPRCLVKDGGNASIFKALTGREWKP